MCLVTQPIQMRFNEIMAGARADLVCKVFGDSYDEMERLAGEVRTRAGKHSRRQRNGI